MNKKLTSTQSQNSINNSPLPSYDIGVGEIGLDLVPGLMPLDYVQGRLDAAKKIKRKEKIQCRPGFEQRGAACQKITPKKGKGQLAAKILATAIAGGTAAALLRRKPAAAEPESEAPTPATVPQKGINKKVLAAGGAAIAVGGAAAVIASRRTNAGVELPNENSLPGGSDPRRLPPGTGDLPSSRVLRTPPPSTPSDRVLFPNRSGPKGLPPGSVPASLPPGNSELPPSRVLKTPPPTPPSDRVLLTPPPSTLRDKFFYADADKIEAAQGAIGKTFNENANQRLNVEPKKAPDPEIRQALIEGAQAAKDAFPGMVGGRTAADFASDGDIDSMTANLAGAGAQAAVAGGVKAASRIRKPTEQELSPEFDPKTNTIRVSEASPHPDIDTLRGHGLYLHNMASQDSAQAKKVKKLVGDLSNSPSVQKLQQTADNHKNAKTKADASFQLQEEQVFARAVAQYVAKKQAMKGAQSKMSSNVKSGKYWNKNDFEMVEKDLEKLFKENKWQ